MPLVAVALAAAAVGVVARRPGAAGRRALPVGAAADAPSAATSAPGCWRRRALPAIALASALVVLGHAVTFLIAARTAGVTAPPSRMLPLALLAMLAMVLPERRRLGAARGRDGVGVRRGRPGCGHGVATAVVYGVMVLVASLPGALVLVAAWLRRRGCAAGARAGRRQPDGAADA